MSSCAAWFGWPRLTHEDYMRIARENAKISNIQFLGELADKLPGLLEKNDFLFKGSTCYGISGYIISKKYPNLFSFIDVQFPTMGPGSLEFTYYLNEKRWASFHINFYEFLRMIGFDEKRTRYSFVDFDKMVLESARHINRTPEPYKFSLLTDSLDKDFSKEDFFFEVAPEFKWCFFDSETLRMDVKDIKLDHMQYLLMKIFREN